MSPDFVLPRAIRPDEHPIDYFWALLDGLSDDEYPEGCSAAFPIAAFAQRHILATVD